MFRFIRNAVRVYKLVLSWQDTDILECRCTPELKEAQPGQLWRVHNRRRCNHPNEKLAEKGEPVGGGNL